MNHTKVYTEIAGKYGMRPPQVAQIISDYADLLVARCDKSELLNALARLVDHAEDRTAKGDNKYV